MARSWSEVSTNGNDDSSSACHGVSGPKAWPGHLEAPPVQGDQLLGDLVDGGPRLGPGLLPLRAAQPVDGGRVAAGVGREQLDLVGGEVEPVVAPVLEQQVVAGGSAHGPGDHAAVAGHAVLAVDDVAARRQVVEEAVDGSGPGPGLAVGPRSAPSRPTRPGRPPGSRAGRTRGRRWPPRSARPAATDRRPDRPRARASPPRPAGPTGARRPRPSRRTAPPRTRPRPAPGPGRPCGSRRPGSAPTPGSRSGGRPDPPPSAPGRRRRPRCRPAAGRRGRAAGGRRPRRPVPRCRPGASASADSSSSSSAARSRTRRGSTRTTSASSPSRSQTSSSPSTSQGSHDSMPSNCWPSAMPVPLVAAPGRAAHEGGGPFAHGLVGHQLATAEQLDPSEVLDRPLVGHVEPGEPVDLVAPQVDADRLVGRRGEDVDDAAPDGQLAPVLDDRLAPVAQAHQVGDEPVDARPGRRVATTSGRAAVRQGPSRCRTALTGATTMPGARPAPAPPSRHSSRSRRPMVWTSGLTRSKGRVSQAGKTSTDRAAVTGPDRRRPRGRGPTARRPCPSG